MDNYIKNDFAQGKIPFELSKLTLFERSRLLDTMRQNSKLVRIIAGLMLRRSFFSIPLLKGSSFTNFV